MGEGDLPGPRRNRLKMSPAGLRGRGGARLGAASQPLPGTLVVPPGDDVGGRG